MLEKQPFLTQGEKRSDRDEDLLLEELGSSKKRKMEPKSNLR
jgi:hypothetical protein